MVDGELLKLILKLASATLERVNVLNKTRMVEANRLAQRRFMAG
jgi:hypothetical protein